MDHRAEHRRRVRAVLEEHGVGDDGSRGCQSQQSRNRVLWAVQQDTHGETALVIRLDGG
jgi:hypothetical protein